MKKITFILFALFTGTAFAQSSASGTATVNAEIVAPISIKDGTALNFGSINGTSTGGNVRVNMEGTRTFSNPDMEMATATTPSAARFLVTAADNYAYNIFIPAITLTGITEGETMAVTFDHDLSGNPSNGTGTGTGGQQALRVGGVLVVADGQAPDQYEGTVTVTVAYQ